MVTIETTTDTLREKSLMDYRKKLLEHKEVESRLKESKFFFLRLCLHKMTNHFCFNNKNNNFF